MTRVWQKAKDEIQKKFGAQPKLVIVLTDETHEKEDAKQVVSWLANGMKTSAHMFVFTQTSWQTALHMLGAQDADVWICAITRHAAHHDDEVARMTRMQAKSLLTVGGLAIYSL